MTARNSILVDQQSADKSDPEHLAVKYTDWTNPKNFDLNKNLNMNLI